jgi:RNA polymerase sigma-70 factor, ECF subfamily
VESVPAQSVAAAVSAERAPGDPCAVAPSVLDELSRTCSPDACGLSRAEFEQIVLRIGMAHHFGLGEGLAAQASPAQQSACFATLRMPDLILARACAAGSERAWERFIEIYRQPLLRAGTAITGNESLGRELADSLYAELYGLTVRDGERRCPLDSYSGRGSLIGWLRTTLAQRYVDRHRPTHREQPLEESADGPSRIPPREVESDPRILPLLSSCVKQALQLQGPEEQFLLASYYLDNRKLHQIAAILGVHEATVSRKLKRLTGSLRKQIVLALERRGMSRREAQEALATDPRDLTASDHLVPGHPHPEELKLKELLQTSQPSPFKEQAES